MPEIVEIKGVGPVLAAECAAVGFESVEKIAGAKANELAAIRGVGELRAKSLISAAQSLLGDSVPAITTKPKSRKSEEKKKRKQKKKNKNGSKNKKKNMKKSKKSKNGKNKK